MGAPSVTPRGGCRAVGASGFSPERITPAGDSTIVKLGGSGAL